MYLRESDSFVELNLTRGRGAGVAVRAPLARHDVHGRAVLLDATDVVPHNVPHRDDENAGVRFEGERYKSGQLSGCASAFCRWVAIRNRQDGAG